MLQKTETPTPDVDLDSIPLSDVHNSLTNSVGVRVGRSEAGRHGHGTQAHRDRVSAREYHRVSFYFALSRVNTEYTYSIVFQYAAKCHRLGRASEKAGAAHRKELDRRGLVSNSLIDFDG